MRTQIVNALKRRNRAVQNAVQAYNTAAAKLKPPKPSIEWSQISQYEFIQDFTLLRDSNPELTTKPWADPVVRVTMKQHLRVQRAREELVRLNIELRRVHTHIDDEVRLLCVKLAEVRQSQSAAFAYSLKEYSLKRC